MDYDPQESLEKTINPMGTRTLFVHLTFFKPILVANDE